jgi:O-antigen/teichoic acid export membrane protein
VSVATAAPTVRASGPRSLLGTVVSLAATTGITSVLGVAFWWLAAHRASLGAVGNGSAAVSAMTLVGTFGMAGLNTTLIPHLARRSRDGDGLLAAGLCAAALVSAVLAAGFELAAAAAGGGFAPYLHAGPEALVFVVGSALTGACLVLDEALLGLVGGTPQLWRNSTFAVTKLAALAGLTVLWHDQFGTSILTAWVAGTALSLAVAAALLRLRGVRLLSRPQWAMLRQIGRASMRNTWLNNALQAPTLVTPMIVTGLLGAEQGGAFYVAATMLSIVLMLSFHFSTALYAANAADPDGLAAKLRFTLRVCLLGGLAGVPLVIAAAHPLLHVFGAQYAARATLPLQVMIAGYFGSVLQNHYVALLRIYDKVTKAAVYATVTCVIGLAAMVAGALAGGLPGVSVALLVTMCAGGLYTIPTLRAALRGERPAAADKPGTQVRPARAAPTRSRVVYFVQTHTQPAQIARLVRLLAEGSPDALVLVSHDTAGQPLDVAGLQALGNVHVLLGQGGYGDFSHLDRYLAAVDWLDANGVEYDWLENLTGQDYPLRPIAEIEETLAATDSDGFLLYSPVFPERVPPGADQGAAAWYRLCPSFDAKMRYDYRHRLLGRPSAAKQRLLRPLMAVNLVQPWIRVSTSFSAVGVRRRGTVFGPDFVCYGGSFFCTLRADCARYVRDYARANPDVVAFFRATLAPDEVFLQSVLVNSGRFTFIPDARRYIDWTGSKHNHPKTLGTEDATAMLASEAHWARKLDLGQDAKLFDILDERIRRGPAKPHIARSRGLRPLAGLPPVHDRGHGGMLALSTG